MDKRERGVLMSSEDVIGISRDFFEAVLTPSNTYFWVTIVFGLGFMVLGFRFFWGLSPYREDILPFELGEGHVEDLSFRSFMKNLFFRTLMTGPVIGILTFGLSALYFQGRYDAAQEQFQRDLENQDESVFPMFQKLYKRLDEQDDRDARAIEEVRRLKAQLEFTQVAAQSHPDGCFVRKDIVYLQLIDGYAENGEVIWSKRIVALEVWRERLVKHRFFLRDHSKSEPFSLEKLKYLSGPDCSPSERIMENRIFSDYVPVTAMEATKRRDPDGRDVLEVRLIRVPFKEGGRKDMSFEVEFPTR